MTVNGVTYEVGLWDTAGQEDYDRLRPLTYPQTDCFIIVVSIGHPHSLEAARDKWWPEITHYCPSVPFILVGTNLDMRSDTEALERLKSRGESPVTAAQGRKLAVLLGAKNYFECSARTQAGLKEAFDEAIMIGAGLNSLNVKLLEAERVLMAHEVSETKKRLGATSKRISAQPNAHRLLLCLTVSKKFSSGWSELELVEEPLNRCCVAITPISMPSLIFYVARAPSGPHYLLRQMNSPKVMTLEFGKEQVIRAPSAQDFQANLVLYCAPNESGAPIVLEVIHHPLLFVSVAQKVGGSWVDQEVQEMEVVVGSTMPVPIKGFNDSLQVTLTTQKDSFLAEVKEIVHNSKQEAKPQSSKGKEGKEWTVFKSKTTKVEFLIINTFSPVPIKPKSPEAASSSPSSTQTGAGVSASPAAAASSSSPITADLAPPVAPSPASVSPIATPQQVPSPQSKSESPNPPPTAVKIEKISDWLKSLDEDLVELADKFEERGFKKVTTAVFRALSDADLEDIVGAKNMYALRAIKAGLAKLREEAASP